MYCIVPLAGPDFYDEKYGIKPLFNVNGKPLIEEAIFSRAWYASGHLKDENIIFVLRDSEKAKEMIDLIEVKFKGSKIVVISDLTQGALFSALSGIPLIRDLNAPVIVDLVDILYVSDISPLDVFREEKEADGILPFFCSCNKKYSYMSIEDSYVSKTAEKNVISEYASAGTYFFRNISVYLDAVNYSIEHKKELAVNDIFYLCPAFNSIIEKGRKVVPVKVGDVVELSLNFHG